jgi:glycosyltransferase involved in cell wall biosynthesis
MSMLEQITPLILTFNEAPNIERTLKQLRWAGDILVVDSYSDDNTLEIVSRQRQARVLQRVFDSFANQCNYGLEHGAIGTEWVLNLDADYVLTDELVDELKSLAPDHSIDGYQARFVYCVNGRRLRSGIYPPVTVLFRKIKAKYRADGHAHRVVVDGRIANLKSPILHDDRKPLSRWFTSQARYTELEAKKLLTAESGSLSWMDRIRRLRVIAPPAMLFYCLILRGGVLDGWAGFYYAFQRAAAELMLSLYLLEHATATETIISMSEAPVGSLNTQDSTPELKAQSTKL